MSVPGTEAQPSIFSGSDNEERLRKREKEGESLADTERLTRPRRYLDPQESFIPLYRVINTGLHQVNMTDSSKRAPPRASTNLQTSDNDLKEVESCSVRCHLLELPSELLIMIYHHLFKNALIELEGISNFTLTGPANLRNFPRQILDTCRQLRQEARPYLFAASTLELRQTIEKGPPLPSSYFPSIPRLVIMESAMRCKKQLRIGLFHSLKTLELRSLTIWCMYQEDTYLIGPEGEECMIQLAMFNLKRTNIQLHQLCADKTRSFKILLGCQFVVTSKTHGTIVRDSRFLPTKVDSCG